MKSSRDILVAAGLLLAVALVYGQTARFAFLEWDDDVYVTENPLVREGLTGGALWQAWTSVVGANWHPLTVLSHAADVELFGLDPGAHHLVSVLFHAANSMLLYAFLRRSTGDVGRPAFVAALFAVHPLHVESVAWIAERKDVLSSFFALSLLVVYRRYAESRALSPYALVSVLLLCGLLSKAMLVTLPVVLLLFDFWPLGRGGLPFGRTWLPLVREKLPLFALAFAFGLIGLATQRAAGAVADLERLPFGLRAENALVSTGLYLRQAVWPSGLAFFYPYPSSIGASSWLAAATLLAAITAAAVRLASRAPAFLVGWLFYLVTLLPVIGLIQLGPQAHADRYTYLPLVGPFVVVAWSVPWGFRLGRIRPLAWLGGALVLVAAARAHGEVRHWRDGESLFRRAIEVTSGNYVAHANLAWLLERQGRLEEAEREARAALALRPQDERALVTLGNVAYRRGDLAEAEDHFQAAAEAAPASAKAWYNLGTVRYARGDLPGAALAFGRAVAAAPGMAAAHNNLGTTLERLGRSDEAVLHYREALRLDPGSPTARSNLARIERDGGGR